MNFQVKHRGIECPASLKQTLVQKLQRLKRVVPETAYVELELEDHTKHHNRQKEAEVLVDIPGQKSVLRFRSTGETFLAAVDRALDRLDDALSRAKERRADKRHKKPIKDKLALELSPVRVRQGE